MPTIKQTQMQNHSARLAELKAQTAKGRHDTQRYLYWSEVARLIWRGTSPDEAEKTAHTTLGGPSKMVLGTGPNGIRQWFDEPSLGVWRV